MCSALVAMKMCTRERGASASAAVEASMSESLVRQREATVVFFTARATARTPSKSPGDEAAKPASMTSTPSRSSCSPISTFSSGRSAIPGACSPSRSVVSKIVILRELNVFLLDSPASVRADLWRPMWAYAPRGAWSQLPLEGENQEDEAGRTRRGCGATRAPDPGCGRDQHWHSLVTMLYFVKSL